jgi:C-terminal processing protease CtpA/Prc
LRPLLVIGALGLVACATTGTSSAQCPVSGQAAIPGITIPVWQPDLPPIPSRARARSLTQARLLMGHDLHAPSWSLLVGSAADGLNASVGIDSRCQSASGDVPYRGLSTAMVTAFERRLGVTEDDLVETAARAMTESLNDGSRYWSRLELQRFWRGKPPDLESTFGLGMGGGVPFPVVVMVVPGSPAEATRIVPGEQVLSVDGRSVAGQSGLAVMEALAGVPDRDVVLELAYADSGRRKVTLNRGLLGGSRAIGCRLLGLSVLYLRVPRLGSAAPSQIREAARSAGEMSSRLILDLRGNEGGSTAATFGVVDLFVSSGMLGEVVERSGRKPITAKPGDPLETATVVVLVNRETKGGGEMIAFSIQNRRRGWVLGERTGGGTDVHQYWPLEAGDALQVVTGQVLAPGGVRFTGEVQPDVDGETELVVERPSSDVPCPGTEDAGEVQADVLVRRAVQLLRRPGAPVPQPTP